MNPLPLFLIIVALPLLLGGCRVKYKPTNETKQLEEKHQAVDKVTDLPLLPETMTKEFIMDLWAKPHDGRDMIEEFSDKQAREGIWKVISNRGSRKGEIIDTIESTMTLKMVDRRYHVWEWKEGENHGINNSIQSDCVV